MYVHMMSEYNLVEAHCYSTRRSGWATVEQSHSSGNRLKRFTFQSVSTAMWLLNSCPELWVPIPQQCCMRAVVHSAHATNRRTIHKDSSCEPQRVCCLLSHVLHNTVLDLLRSCRWGWLGELLRTRPGLHRSAVFEHQDYMQVILNTWQWWIYICMYIIRIDGVVEAHATEYIELEWCWAYM